jgi:beta-lactamase class A
VTNDVAIAWPPERQPIIVSVFYAESPADGNARNAMLAEVARVVTAGG